MWASAFAIFLVASVSGHQGHDHDHANHSLNEASVDAMTWKFPITVYYESLCPDSIAFFKSQLSPAYAAFGKNMDLTLVPYGKSQTQNNNGTYTFTCHHGSIECFGNIAQACAIRKLHTSEHRYQVVSCMMESIDRKTVSNSTYPVQMCLNKYQLEPTELDDCIKSPLGGYYLAEMGNRTLSLNPKLKGVPSVEINGTYSYAESDKALADLKGYICSESKAAKFELKECNSCNTIVPSSFLITMMFLLYSKFL